MTEAEIVEGRKHLDKGHTREQNTAHTVGYDNIEADGNDVKIVMPTHMSQAAIPRDVAEEIFGQMWGWASGSKENFALMAQMIRKQEPDAYGHLSDDELATKLQDHAKAAARKAVEEVYKKDSNKWDQGNDLDMWEGKGYTLKPVPEVAGSTLKGDTGGDSSDTD